MEIDEIEWLRRENYFLREQNEKLKNELDEIKKYIEDMLIKASKEKDFNFDKFKLAWKEENSMTLKK